MRYLRERLPCQRAETGLIPSFPLSAERRSAPPFLRIFSERRFAVDRCDPGGGEHSERISRRVSVLVGNGYTFNTDTVLLAWYSLPKRGERCADLGTGCGTIPLYWCAYSAPESVWGVEIQPEACGMASRSVRLNGLDETVHIVQNDVRDLLKAGAVPRDLDAVACNPPYKERGTGVPSAARSDRLARHEELCAFSDFAAAAAGLLRWGGRFTCCLRPERLCGAMLDLRAAGLEPKRLRFVQQNYGAAPFLFLLQASRGGKPGLVVEPVLPVQDETGKISPEMLRIYGDYKEGRE